MHQGELGESIGEGAVPWAEPAAMNSPEFEAIYPALRRFAATISDSDIDPDDLVQEALARYLRRFTGSVGARHPQAYLKTAIWGLVRNERRRFARHQRGRLETDEPHVDEYPSDVASLLALASPQERALLLLVDVEGEPIGSAATVLGISSVAARARLSRVRRRLRSEMGGPDAR